MSPAGHTGTAPAIPMGRPLSVQGFVLSSFVAFSPLVYVLVARSRRSLPPTPTTSVCSWSYGSVDSDVVQGFILTGRIANSPSKASTGRASTRLPLAHLLGELRFDHFSYRSSLLTRPLSIVNTGLLPVHPLFNSRMASNPPTYSSLRTVSSLPRTRTDSSSSTRRTEPLLPLTTLLPNLKLKRPECLERRWILEL